jgi:hypothetical protein
MSDPASQALAILTPAVAEFELARPRVEALYHPQTQAEADFAGLVADEIAAEVKDLEERWSTVTTPLYQAHQAACAMRRPAIEPRKAAIVAIKAGVKAFLDAGRRQAEVELAAAAASGSVEAIANVEAPQVPKGMSARSHKKYRVVDEALVPSKFKTINHALLANAIDAGEVVPGVEIYFETEVRRTGVRGKAGGG